AFFDREIPENLLEVLNDKKTTLTEIAKNNIGSNGKILHCVKRQKNTLC
ncbi:unnamed protein product, partial [Allacma fusca]